MARKIGDQSTKRQYYIGSTSVPLLTYFEFQYMPSLVRHGPCDWVKLDVGTDLNVIQQIYFVIDVRDICMNFGNLLANMV